MCWSEFAEWAVTFRLQSILANPGTPTQSNRRHAENACADRQISEHYEWADARLGKAPAVIVKQDFLTHFFSLLTITCPHVSHTFGLDISSNLPITISEMYDRNSAVMG